MEITTEIDRETQLRTHRVRGVITKEELIGTLKRIYEMTDYSSSMNVIWDVRESDMSFFQTTDVHVIRDFVSRHWGGNEGSRAALVVSREADYWLSRLYAILSEGSVKGEVRVFRDMEEAMQWVRE